MTVDRMLIKNYLIVVCVHKVKDTIYGGLCVRGWVHTFLCMLLGRERKTGDLACLFNLYQLVCVAFDWGVNHCPWGHSYSESSWIWEMDLLMSICTYVCQSSIHCCIKCIHTAGIFLTSVCLSSLKNGWKGLPGHCFISPQQSRSSIFDKLPSTSIFAAFLKMCFISLLTCLSHAFAPVNSWVVRRSIYLSHLCIQRLVVGLIIRAYYKQLKPTDTE